MAYGDYGRVLGGAACTCRQRDGGAAHREPELLSDYVRVR